MNQNPFNTPRGPSQTPYWLRNGIHDHEYIERAMAEHRRRLGIHPDQIGYGFSTRLADERAVVDALLMDIAASRIAAPQALAHLNEWRKQHDVV